MAMKGYITEQVKEIKDPVKFAAFQEAFLEKIVEAGMVKVIYMGPAVAAFELGEGKEKLPNAIFETETLQAAIDLLTTPQYMECLAAAGGDMAAVAIRDIRVIEAEEGWFKPGKGYWHSHYDSIVSQDAFMEYYGKTSTTFIGPGVVGDYKFNGPGVLGAKVSIPLDSLHKRRIPLVMNVLLARERHACAFHARPGSFSKACFAPLDQSVLLSPPTGVLVQQSVLLSPLLQ